MNNPFHSRKSSTTNEDVNPFDTAENYYGNQNNPLSQKNSRLGKVRTFSVFQPKSRSSFFDDDEEEPSIQELVSSNGNSSVEELRDDFSELGIPCMDKKRRPSIMPIYGDVQDTEEGMKRVTDKLTDVSPKSSTVRRASLDDTFMRPKCFYISDIDLTLEELLKNEDTDRNYQITIEDTGPKILSLGTVNSNGYKSQPIRGTYMLSNLLQELTIARRFGRKQMILDERRLTENPVSRMKRLISTQFWHNLSRRMSPSNVLQMSADPKILDEIKDSEGNLIRKEEPHRIYVPHGRNDQYEYFLSMKKLYPNSNFDVQYLPEKIDPTYVHSISRKPGLLALSAYPDPETKGNLINEPYVVPGGRFNEQYGWDSYFETLGLLVDVNKDDTCFLALAKGMAENFIYEIEHYGKILNANRSYYLNRSQPPFLTDMAIRIFDKMLEVEPEKFEEAQDFLLRSTYAAIKEYETVWISSPRFDAKTGLSCYHCNGKGIPPETEATHFETVLSPYLKKYGISQEEFIELYNSEKISEPKLDEYFLHDRAVRESGHDTSYRLEGKCAFLATVDLNSLLYKYETDISFIIDKYLGNKLICPGSSDLHTKEKWSERAERRKEAVNKYLWNENDGLYYDYHIKTCTQTGYVSATTFWPLWSGLASKEQAFKLVHTALPQLEEYGGIVAGTLDSRGTINLSRPSRQWDYPYGWAPHQMLAWIGFRNYGYEEIAKRLCYRWLYMMTQAFVDYNGVVVEKYNVTRGSKSHKVDAEYGNQGADFKGVATEGFGWVNASYVFGLTMLDVQAQRSLGTLTPPELFIKYMHKSPSPNS